MIMHDGMSEILNYRKIREVGLTEEYFFDLPYEYQKAILMAGLETQNKNDLQKRIALEQYNLEEKVKEKVLKLLKRKK